DPRSTTPAMTDPGPSCHWVRFGTKFSSSTDRYSSALRQVDLLDSSSVVYPAGWRAGLPHQRAQEARDSPGGEIETGDDRKRRPVVALAGWTRPTARDRHQYGEAKDHCPGGCPHQDRISIMEGDKAERQSNKTAERQAQ